MGDYGRKSGLAQTRRAVKQNMVKAVASVFCRLYIYFQVLLDLFLTDILVKCFRSKACLLYTSDAADE